MEERRRFTASGVLLVLAFVIPASVFGAWWLSTFVGHPAYSVGRKTFGNIPAGMKAIFYVGMAAALGITTFLFAMRAKNWQRGAAEDRTGLWKRRLTALDRGLRMKTLLEDRKAGVMHAMVYYGFLVLFAGTVTLEIDNLAPADFKFLHGEFYQGYSMVLDLAAVVFLAGLALAFYRRYVAKPWRIKSKTKPEDFWILVTLALIGVTGVAVEAARISVDGRPSFEIWSFVGYPLSNLVPAGSASGVPPGAVGGPRRRLRSLPGGAPCDEAAPHGYLAGEHVPLAAGAPKRGDAARAQPHGGHRHRERRRGRGR